MTSGRAVCLSAEKVLYSRSTARTARRLAPAFTLYFSRLENLLTARHGLLNNPTQRWGFFYLHVYSNFVFDSISHFDDKTENIFKREKT